MKLTILAAITLALGIVLGLALSTTAFEAEARPPSPSPTPSPPQQVLEQNLDASGHIAVHEQGTANVSGTVDVGNLPLDAQGNVRVSEAPESARLDFTHLLVDVCTSSPTNFCNPATDTIRDVDAALANFSQQGWRLVGVEFTGSVTTGGRVLYTLSRPAP